ncbi:MAG TPA: glycosyl hydrolase family 88 [Candidatus Limiplasma sp.]|nr:glycosyl hydrolase family 88 [Candidatus Limiplasma sp.]
MTYEQLRQNAMPFAQSLRDKLIAKMPVALAKAQGLDFIPYTVRGNAWAPGPFDGICWWTNGFWAGEMWLMYLMTGDAAYRTEAEHTEAILDAAFADFEHLHHDVGFMWRISAGVNHAITGSAESHTRALLAATLLAGRFNPLGFIRAWNGDCIGWAIIDCMLNISLLYWASEQTGDPRFRMIAMAHADTTMRCFVRADGSVSHIVQFNPETMAVEGIPAGQGYAPGSSWSRGQAWAMYGFALSYLHTGKQAYLETAKRVSEYFIAQVSDDWVPRCDFRQPDSVTLKDSCAGAVAACALLELSKLDIDEAERYFDAAIHLLTAMDAACADWGDENPAILQKCTGSYHGQDHHIAMTYADFYLIEAVSKLLGDPLLFW